MSLDFSLYAQRRVEVFEQNITHNLTKMASEAGIYEALWRPEENGYKYANEITGVLEEGLRELKTRRDHFEKLNPENGWGTYEGLVKAVQRVLDACYENPDGEITSCT